MSNGLKSSDYEMVPNQKKGSSKLRLMFTGPERLSSTVNGHSEFKPSFDQSPVWMKVKAEEASVTLDGIP